MTRSVVIVDDSPAFRASATRLLRQKGYEVVGEAVDGASAVAAVTNLRPQVVLLDIQLPDMDGFEVARRLETSGSAVVLISGRSEKSYRGRLGRSAVLGFVHKGELAGGRLEAVLAPDPR